MEFLYSADEWIARGFTDLDTDRFSSGVASTSGLGGVAHTASAAPEDTPSHVVDIEFPPGEYLGNEAKYELTCSRCGYLRATDSLPEAEAHAAIHEVFISVLVDVMETK